MPTLKRKIEVPEHIDSQKLVSLKSMGNIQEIAISDSHNSEATLKPISKDEYLLCSTGEVKQFEHHALDRTENIRNLQKTMHCLSDLINANVYPENVECCRFITFTYRENMTDTEQLYIDFRNFNKRFKRYMEKLGHHYEYIITVEAQERGAFHLHGIFIFSRKAPYIENSVLADMWGLGFVSIKALDKNIDNIGKYLTSYLTDLPVDDTDITPDLMGGDIKEISNKRIIKGARLKLLPVGIRIYRYSRGIKKPKVKSISYGEALKELSDSGFSKVNEYEKHKEKIETALNLKIISINIGKDMRHVIIKAVNSSNEKSDIICWNDKYLSDKDFELVLGESEFEIECIDIAVTPHILIGGGTGSGKSKLLKLILMESIKKGAKIYLADFKGGIDYPSVWHKQCEIITKQDKFEKQLSMILEIMEERRHMLVESETSNIREYNEKTNSSIARIIIACDEIAEVLDKTGLNKNEKELVNKIESKLSTIARQGRAFGIHLILATQRPDAEILKGQIKNNISYRVCGRADKILSQIILDTPQCANMIAPNEQGMFLTNTGVLFKAYYVEDECLKGVDL